MTAMKQRTMSPETQDEGTLATGTRLSQAAHHTKDGPIELWVEQVGVKWAARVAGERLEYMHPCETAVAAHRHAVKAFGEMFPEHRCGARCVPRPRARE